MSELRGAEGSTVKRVQTAEPDPRAILGPVHASNRRLVLGLIVAGAALLLACIASLALGAKDISPEVVLDALLGRRPVDDYDASVVLTERLPRTLLALLVGTSLGAAGAIMQAITRNPLVDGGVLGIELGAACAVVVGIVVLGITDAGSYFWLALLGAAVTTALVVALSRITRMLSRAVGLVIVGAAVAAMLAAVINLLIIRDQAAFARYRFWSVGELAGRADMLPRLWLFALIGLVAAVCCGGLLNGLSLGEQAAAGLGIKVRQAQLGTAVIAVLLCATATAACGPIGFVGLVGAHLARLMVGADQRRVIPAAMLCGALLLVIADTAGRLGPGNGEVAVGVMTAVIGTPFFVALARRRRLVEL